MKPKNIKYWKYKGDGWILNSEHLWEWLVKDLYNRYIWCSFIDDKGKNRYGPHSIEHKKLRIKKNKYRK